MFYLKDKLIIIKDCAKDVVNTSLQILNIIFYLLISILCGCSTVVIYYYFLNYVILFSGGSISCRTSPKCDTVLAVSLRPFPSTYTHELGYFIFCLLMRHVLPLDVLIDSYTSVLLENYRRTRNPSPGEF